MRKLKNFTCEHFSGDYEFEELNSTLKSLKVYKPRPNEVHTVFRGTTICKAAVSEKYEAFDFSKYVLDHLGIIEEQFQPQSFKLEIHKGYQELRLFRKPELINLDEYKPMFVVLNSSNCSLPLSVNFGMLRSVCGNGMVIGRSGEHFGFKVKHYKDAISKRVADLDMILENYQTIFNRNRALIESYAGSYVSYFDFLDSLLIGQNKEIQKNTLQYAQNLGKKLLFSNTDRLASNEVNWKQKRIILSPQLMYLDDKNNEDIQISKHKIFQCYTEMFSKSNSLIQKRETTRIFNILESMK